ncbi:MAG: HAD-IA family hydrolase [Alphaproteobacteria bacterium]|nr:HAD-IA family hydrolase [Alphaproteobacteria bacterium]
MPHRFKAILFDLDGTIIDSAPDLCATMNILLAEENRRQIKLDEMKSCTGDGLKVMLEKAWRLTTDNGVEPLTPDRVPALMQRFLKIYEGIIAKPECIYPGMLEFLQTEFENGTKLAVVTNKHEAAARRILAQLKLADYFHIVIGGDTLRERKPHPMPILHVLHEFKIANDDAVMIGDSPNDALSARDAGIPSIILTYGYNHDWPADLKPAAYAIHVHDCRLALQLI